MKKTKRILAAVAALLLFAMYGATLVFSLLNLPASEDLLMASVACTIIFPVLLYAYILVYRVLKGPGEEDQDQP